MARGVTTLPSRPAIPPLEGGDRLTRAEFHRRYEASSHVKKAELINGVVYMPSPVSYEHHGRPHAHVVTWLGVYEAATPGVEIGDNTTVLLVGDNELQPDAFLRIAPAHGGQSRSAAGGYVEGAPELIAEVAASSASYDLHDKLDAYRRGGVREYVVWRVFDGEIDWFVLRESGQFERLTPRGDGLYQSECFPGLWLDAGALLRGDLARVLEVLRRGLATPGHAEFLSRSGASPSP